jgi:hypothetical protein
MAVAFVPLDRNPAGPWPMVDARTGEPAAGCANLTVPRSGSSLAFVLFGPAGYLLARLVRGDAAELAIPMTARRLGQFRQAQALAVSLVVAGVAFLAGAVIAGGSARFGWTGVEALFAGLVVRAVNRGVQLPSASQPAGTNGVRLLGVHDDFASAVAAIYRPAGDNSGDD